MIKFKTDQPIAVNLNQVEVALSQIRNDSMSGWLDLPETYDQAEFAKIKQAADQIKADSKCLVCIGIGGSYLGHRALIEALGRNDSSTKVLYAGNSLSPRSLEKLFTEIGEQDFSINVISKSGTTLEPAIAFRFFKERLLKKYGHEGAAKRIYATTDANKGALHGEAVQEGYARFVVPDGVGGRYSVLTPVGLLPLAVAGINIDELLSGAQVEQSSYVHESNLGNITAVQYAAMRAELLRQKYTLEVLATFEPDLQYLEEWWKQLFGESEGKNHQGIFPASVVYTTDLHSLGQYLQDGRRDIFETFLEIEQASTIDYAIPTLPGADVDGLKYLEDKMLSNINQTACEATIAAHRSGGIPVSEVIMPDLSERSLGALIYFFEYACALSAKLSGVNPFDQPGVEMYKNNLFRLLGKPVSQGLESL